MFVQHYLTNMFGADKEEFLSQKMDDDRGNRIVSRPKTTEDPGTVLATPQGRKIPVREMSRLAGYLQLPPIR
jgi:hypothetical protein